MDKETIKKHLVAALNRNIICYDSEDQRGIFTLRLARIMIDTCIRTDTKPEFFIIPNNDNGCRSLIDNLGISASEKYPLESNKWKIYGKPIKFIDESDYQELLNIFDQPFWSEYKKEFLPITLPQSDSHFCLCGNEEKMLLGSF